MYHPNVLICTSVFIMFTAFALLPKCDGKEKEGVVMSVDLGSQNMKVAVFKDGVGMEMALSKHYRRTTPSLVALKDGKILIGQDALDIGIDHPEMVYAYFVDLLGKKWSNPMVSLYQERFPHHQMEPDEQDEFVFVRGTEKLRIVELVGILLREARRQANMAAGYSVRDVVVAVPVYFNQAERRAVVDSVKIAGLNLIQLINDNAAVAASYAAFKLGQITEVPENILIYDQGAWKTTASFFRIQLQSDPVSGKKVPQITFMGAGYDRTLGGLALTLQLRDQLLAKAKELVQTDLPIENDPQAMAKLFYKAEELKITFTLDTFHDIEILNFMEGKDFRVKVTRDEYEIPNIGFWNRLHLPIDQAMQMANIALEQISTVILFGGLTNTPLIRIRIRESLAKLELLFGRLSFRRKEAKAVKYRVTADCVGLCFLSCRSFLKQCEIEVFGGVEFFGYVSREPSKFVNLDDGVALGAVYRAAVLSPQITDVKPLNLVDSPLCPLQINYLKWKRTERQEDTMKYRLLHDYKESLPGHRVLSFRHKYDFTFKIQVDDMSWMNTQQKSEYDDAGIAIIEVAGVSEAIPKYSNEQLTYKGTRAHFYYSQSGIISVHLVELIFGDEKVVIDDESTMNNLPLIMEETDSLQTLPTESFRVRIPFKAIQLGLANATDERLAASKAKLIDIEEGGNRLEEKEIAYKNLETFVLETLRNLEKREWEVLSSESDGKRLLTDFTETRKWIAQLTDSDKNILNEKLGQLKEKMKDLEYKHEESIMYPKARERLYDMLNHSSDFLNALKETDGTPDQFFAVEDMNRLEKQISDTRKWWIDVEAKHGARQPYDPPFITYHQLSSKVNSLDNLVKSLIMKMEEAFAVVDDTVDSISPSSSSTNPPPPPATAEHAPDEL